MNWRLLGTHPLAGEYKSRQEFRDATFAKLGKLFPYGLRVYTRDVLVAGERAAVELHANVTAKSGLRFNRRILLDLPL